MADIGDVTVALVMDGRLVGAAFLQVVEADEAHVRRLRRIADFRFLRKREWNECDPEKRDEKQ